MTDLLNKVTRKRLIIGLGGLGFLFILCVCCFPAIIRMAVKSPEITPQVRQLAPLATANLPTFTPEPTFTIAPTTTPEPTFTPNPTPTLEPSPTPAVVELSPTPEPPPPSQASLCPQGCDAPQPGCEIKGNINSEDERIYHAPGWRDYDKTEIDPSKGERYFCTAQEAEANGWRAAQQ